MEATLKNSLDDMNFVITRKWRECELFAQEARRKYDARRIEVGTLLLEQRGRVEAGEAGDVMWWDYYAKHFAARSGGRSRGDAEKLMAMASAENPQAAYEAAKEKNRQHNKDYRERRELSPLTVRGKSSKPQLSLVEADPPPADEIQHDLIDQAIDLVRQMNIPTRARFAAQLKAVWRH